MSAATAAWVEASRVKEAAELELTRARARREAAAVTIARYAALGAAIAVEDVKRFRTLDDEFLLAKAVVRATREALAAAYEATGADR